MFLLPVGLSKESNADLYERCKEQELDKAICNRRLRWTGHLLRLDEDITARKVLKNITIVYKGQKRTSKKTWLKQINYDLKQIDKDMDIHSIKQHTKHLTESGGEGTLWGKL